MDALAISDLRKVYANKTEALKGIDLTVKAGDFFALLGPNGAGKTTTIGIVTSLVRKTSGTVRVFGHDLDSQRETVKSHIGVVPQEVNLNMFERNFNTLVNQAGYYGVPLRVAKEGVKIAAEKIGKNASEFSLHVKGQELPAHDPRSYNAGAVSYATSNRGACHLAGFTHAFERLLSMPDPLIIKHSLMCYISSRLKPLWEKFALMKTETPSI